MKPTSSSSKPGRPFLWVFTLLVIVLGVLFWKSFVPGYVQFSNDAPLGQMHPDWVKLPSGIFGLWSDLNDIGFVAGAFSPSVTTLILWLFGPVGTSKFLIPVALLILGLGTWAFFRQLRLAPAAAILGALAAALTSTFFSDACWGVAGHEIAFGLDFLALALIASNGPDTPRSLRWTRLALAGLLVGLNVADAADIGAIFSVLVAAFTVFHSWCGLGGAPMARLARGVGRVIVIALFAVFIAAQAVVTLITFDIKGVVGTGQSAQAKAAHWDFATTWSFPKAETLGIIVPGLFGYRMDTPEGGEYWGAIGRDPGWDRYFAGQQSAPPAGQLRFCGAGYYAGVLVVLVALWAIAQVFRGRDSVFSETHRRSLWFWTALLVVSLLLAWGRFAPFYALLYKLPYFSTIRNPTKFLFVFAWALVTIFAYGIHGLSRRCLEVPTAGAASPTARLKSWWARVRGFDRNWTWLCAVVFAASLLAWLIFALKKPALVGLLKATGFDSDEMAGLIADFSILQVGWFILFYLLAAGLLTAILSGQFAGSRARWAAILLGALLVADLGRADLPWIVPLNYLQKNDVDPANPTNSINPVINFLRHKPYEHRVVGLPVPPQLAQRFALFEEMYRIEWAQHHFPYYNIQSLDKIQMSRPPVDLATYEEMVTQNVTRWWELTNTRYILAPAAFLDALNQQLDPEHHRFRIAMRFDIAPKPGVTTQDINADLQRGIVPGPKLTAVENPTGDYAVVEFTGALPRVRLYAHWETNRPAELRGFTANGLNPRELDALNNAGTNGFLILKKLLSPSFDPWKTVLLDQPLPPQETAASTTNQDAGTVTFESYAPKDIVLEAHATVPCVLLLNDKYDPDWHVQVDGRPAPLLRCNFIMRGVYLTPGAHTVEFWFDLPHKPLYVSLAAVGVGILLLGFMVASTRRKPGSSPGQQ
ncbi:MAG: hypothetical protein KGJ60_06385 [Verrucomicrobiota bacterium]|nr:hypothetical protein [Verrucomicrobiota bacterium]